MVVSWCVIAGKICRISIWRSPRLRLESGCCEACRKFPLRTRANVSVIQSRWKADVSRYRRIGRQYVRYNGNVARLRNLASTVKGVELSVLYPWQVPLEWVDGSGIGRGETVSNPVRNWFPAPMPKRRAFVKIGERRESSTYTSSVLHGS